MNRIRILIADTPPLLTSILKDAVDTEPDLEIIGSVSLHDALDHVLAGARADVLIVCVPEAENSSLARVVLMASPGTRLLMVARNGQRAVLYELYPIKTELGEVSPRGLIDAIRRSGPPVTQPGAAGEGRG